MSTIRYFRGQRGAELRARWKQEGFIAKGNRELVRVVPNGLHIIHFSGAGSWDTSTSATFGVWLAPFEARTLGEPAPWPAKPFLVPEARRWHATIGLAELVGNKSLARIGGAGYPPEYPAAMVWNHWYVIDRWLQRHTDLPTLAELSIEASRESSWGEWRHFQIAALCFLELGQPERVAEMMHGEWSYYHRPEVARDAPERMRAWWARSAAWWRDVAGLRAPAYDGTPGPEVPAVRAPPPPKPTPRDSIWYESQTGGEWLKTRDLHQAVARVRQLLALTTFETWDELNLEIHAEPTPALEKFTEFMKQGRSDATLPDRRELTFDRASLAAHGLEPDPILGDAIDTFGPPRFECWLGSRLRFWWRLDRVDLPTDWFAFCVAHQTAMVHDRARVTLTLSVRGLFLLDPKTRAPLPFQGDAFCPPPDNTPSWSAHTSVILHLPECKMSLSTRMPFTEPDRAFRRYYDVLAKALGYHPSATHFRALRINKAGSRAYDRKLDLG